MSKFIISADAYGAFFMSKLNEELVVMESPSYAERYMQKLNLNSYHILYVFQKNSKLSYEVWLTPLTHEKKFYKV